MWCAQADASWWKESANYGGVMPAASAFQNLSEGINGLLAMWSLFIMHGISGGIG